jgi:eukaryotic-like serine/threonine-protein kinase
MILMGQIAMKRCPQCGQEYGDNTRFCVQDGQTLNTTDVPATRLVQTDQMLGRTLGGRYRLLEKLGQGGMGSVYKAQHIKMNRLTAVKILTSELAHNRQFVARFEREAEMASQIDHPHAVSIYDFGETDGLVYLAMEFIDGQPLSAILARERYLPLERVVHLMRQAAEALSAAHQLGIIHRDFKPDNVMVCNKPGRPDWVKVVDFGIAKRSSIDPADQLLTQAGAVLGTPQYMSPEQVAGEPVDARSDLYSLAIVTYELLCGRLPFEGPSTTNVMVKRVMEAPTPLHQRIRPQTALPPGVELVIMRALARNPNERYLSTAQFAAELDNAARAPSSGYQQSVRYPVGTTPNLPHPTVREAMPQTRLQIEQSPAYVPGLYDRNQHPRRSKKAIILAVLAIVLIPTLLIGAYFAARYIRGSRDQNPNSRSNGSRVGNENASIAVSEAATPSVSTQERIKRSRAAREANDLTTAEQESRAALTSNPNSAPANTEFAEVLWELERFDEAEKYVNAALRIDPNFGPAHQALGAVYYLRGDLDRTIKEQKLTLQLNPEPEYVAYAHSVLGEVYRVQGRFKEALSEYQAAISSSPRRSIEITPRLGIADIYIVQDRLSEAMEILRALADSGIAQGNDLAWVNIRTGKALLKMKKLDEAIEQYQNASKNATRNNARAEAHLSLGFVYYEQTHYEDALERAKQAIELAKGDNLTSSTAYWLAGAISYQREDFERAIELLEQARQLNPADKNILGWLSLARKKK